jgi:hypothetical protein
MKRAFSLGLVAAGILLISGAVSWSYFNNRVSQSAAVSLPDSIAGLQITNYTTGAQAVTEFENLHGKQFPINSGSIGRYGNQQTTLWVAGVSSNSIALDMIEAMQEKIAQRNSPFTPLGKFHLGNRAIYVLEGMGQRHYYFQSKNLVIWLASDPAIADAAIQQILEVYP